MSELITQDDLSKWTGYTRQGDIEQFLIKNRIEFHRGRGNTLCTTLSAIDKSLRVDEHTQIISVDEL